MDLVDLTGSDSENEGEVTHMEKGFSSQTGPKENVVPRKLPSWAFAASSNSDSSIGLSQRFPIPNSRSTTRMMPGGGKHQPGSEFGSVNNAEGKALYVGNGGTIFSNNGIARRRLPPSMMPNVAGIKIAGSGSGGSTRNLHGSEEASLGSQGDLLVVPTGTAKLNSGYDLNDRYEDSYHFSRVQSNGNSVSKADDKLNPQYGLKRALPLSLLSTVSTTNKQADQKAYMGGDLNRENDDEVFIYETGSTGRVLPPSLMHGKTGTTSQLPGISDTAHRVEVGEERAKETDERLVYQAALQGLSQPKLEANLPDGLLAVPLLRHQRIALAWMVQKETNSFQCLGGILADDQGLGKTISVIALILMERHSCSKFTSNASQNASREALNLDEDDESVSELERIKQNVKSESLNLDADDNNVSKFVKAQQKGKSDYHGRGNGHTGRPAAGTLVVCPASVVRQWARELDEKVTEFAKLSVLVYHGSSRTKDPFELATFDVVVTTYSIVSNEVPKQSLVDDDDEERRNMERYGLSSEFVANKKKKRASNTGKGRKGKKGIDDSSLDPDSGPLARVRWFRVVLDEAQTIKNHKTLVARACCGLRAKRRWCLSGTPIQNSVDDLYSYFRFLKYDPYAIYKSFCSTIKYPISKNATSGYKKLQVVLQTILLRRTKGTLIDGEPIIKLPPKSISLKKVEFSAEERSFYTRLEADSRKQFKAYAAAGTVKQNYANILLMLLRLRQACDHPFLVKGYHSDSDGKLSLDMARKLPRDMQISLLNHLEVSLAICGICNDTPEDAVITTCSHVFCYQCVCDRLEADDNLCPAAECKNQIGMDSIFSRATLRRCISGHPGDNFVTFSGMTEKSEIGQDMCSSKIKAALEILHSLCKFKNPSSSINFEVEGCEERTWDGPVSEMHDKTHSNSQTELPEKAIVFSQWTGMLDLLEIPLKNSYIQYRRLDGTMSLAARDKAIKDFITNPEVTVIIMSLKAGNLGLNMVAACHVLLLDLWWNPTTEDQAIDRAHRIGQTRPVTVSRLTIKDTVEDRILALQEDKRMMVASAFGEDQSGGSATRLTVEDLRYLFMV